MQVLESDRDGAFRFQIVSFGDYTLTVSAPGFASLTQPITLASGTSPILHFELPIATVQQSVSITKVLTPRMWTASLQPPQ